LALEKIIEKSAHVRNTISLATTVTIAQVLVLIIFSSVVFLGLGKSSLLDYDEGIHAQVASEIIQTNDWLTPHFAGDPRFEKPPLYDWTTALFFQLFGINEFWARAGSALSSVLVVIVTYFLGMAIYERRVGFLAALPLISGYEFLRQARNGATDVMLTLTMLLTLTAYVKYSKRGRLAWYLLWISFALGFMVKSWAALLVIIAIGINIVLEGNVKATLRDKHFWGGILVALAIILPWHIAMYQVHGQIFIDRYIVHNLFSRSVDALEGNAGTTRYYFDRMAYDYSAWFLLLPIALAVEAKRVLGVRDRTSVLLVFVILIFGIYSLVVGTKIFHYLTPIYPVFALFHANAIIKAYDNHRSTAFSGLVIAALVATIIPSAKLIGIFLFLVGLTLAALWLASLVSKPARSAIKTPIQPMKVEFTIPAVKWLAMLIGTYTDRKNLPKLAVVIMCSFLFMIGASRSRSLYTVTELPVEQISRIAGKSDAIRDETIIALALPPDYENAIVGPAAMFYSDRPIRVAWSEGELFELTAEGPREIIMGGKYMDFLSDEYDFSVLAKSPPFIYGVVSQR
jgi:4-amino-4-deoxy-L-arabinose transferase-like glycosyltransferase